MMKYQFINILAFIFIVTGCHQGTIHNGEDLIKAMHRKNSKNWYTSLCFSQEVLKYHGDSIYQKETWHEAYHAPGKLIIKFNTWESGDGMLFSRDTFYSFSVGTAQIKMARLHDLVILGLDVNNLEPEITIGRARQMGYDLDKLTLSHCFGKPAYVTGDTNSLCFWVDAESLLFLKMRRVKGEKSREVEFSQYDTIDGYPVATEIRFYTPAGQLEMVERYFNIKVNCQLEEEIFIPENFTKAKM